MTPEVGQIVTVFRSRLLPGNETAYYEHADRMTDLVRTMPGYVEHKAFVAEDGERVTVVTFADQASHDGWANHPDHRAAQRAGIACYYSTYSISVGPVGYASSFGRPADA